MTAVLSRPGPQVGVAVAGAGVLLVRPWLWALGPPAWVVAALFVALGLVGTAWPVGRAGTAGRGLVAATTAAGVGALLAARLLGAGQRALPHSAVAVGLTVLAAVAEEAFFRRFLYGFLLRGGPGLAVAGSAISFALVHIGIYGAGVLPLDLAAGLLFSAQRRASGTWLSPAATHVVANLLAVW